LLTSAIFWQSASTLANGFWAVLESISILIGAYFIVRKARKNKEIASKLLEVKAEDLQEELNSRDSRDAIKSQLEAMNTKFAEQHKAILDSLKTLNYAVFNAGKTGLKNRVDDLWEIVPKMESNIAVILDRTKNL